MRRNQARCLWQYTPFLKDPVHVSMRKLVGTFEVNCEVRMVSLGASSVQCALAPFATETVK